MLNTISVAVGLIMYICKHVQLLIICQLLTNRQYISDEVKTLKTDTNSGLNTLTFKHNRTNISLKYYIYKE